MSFHPGGFGGPGGILCQGAPGQQQVYPLLDTQGTDLPVAFFGDIAQLQHICRYKDATAVTGETPQCLDGRPHGIGTGIVAVLHHGNALMLHHLLALAAGSIILQGLYGGFRRNTHRPPRAKCRQGVQHQVLPSAGDSGAPALALGMQHKIGGKRCGTDDGRLDLRPRAVQAIAYYMEAGDVNGMQQVVIITQQQCGAIR